MLLRGTLCSMKEANHKRTNVLRFHLRKVPRVVTVTGAESTKVGARGQGRGSGEL